MADQREPSRGPIELKVDYKKLNSFFADYAKNISRGGTFIKTRKPLPVGTRFVFRLAVPRRERPFELSGEVIRASVTGDDAGMQIRFVWGDARHRDAFEAAVEELMEQSLGPVVTRKLLRKN